MKNQIKASVSIFASLAALAFFAFSFQAGETTESYATTELSSWTPEEASRGLAGVEEKPAAEQLYKSAREFSAQGRFDECLSKLAVLHQDLIEYEDSRELKNFCTQGKLQKSKREADRRNRRTAAHRSK